MFFFSVSICTCRHFIVSSKVNLASNFNAASYTYINSVCCVSLLEVLVDDVLVYVADGDHVGHPRVRGPVDHGAVSAWNKYNYILLETNKTHLKASGYRGLDSPLSAVREDCVASPRNMPRTKLQPSQGIISTE